MQGAHNGGYLLFRSQLHGTDAAAGLVAALQVSIEHTEYALKIVVYRGGYDVGQGAKLGMMLLEKPDDTSQVSDRATIEELYLLDAGRVQIVDDGPAVFLSVG